MNVPTRYRRIAETFYRVSGSDLDYSERALFEAFERETFGSNHDMSRNGFAFGKKAFDITVASWKEDLADGLFCKWDYLKQYEEESFERDFVWHIIEHFPVKPLFAR